MLKASAATRPKQAALVRRSATHNHKFQPSQKPHPFSASLSAPQPPASIPADILQPLRRLIAFNQDGIDTA
ncbi:MAG: hypothetical protein E7I45_05200, partial [Eikenella corrodens]|uniref:hypothetical protein n=1 Tax=Eikenella corrodens TaxID=539 RepID=UPI00291418E2